MPLPILSNQYQRESASKSREKCLFVQLVNKLLTNCCLSYLKLAGRRRWVMQGAPGRLLFTSSVPMFAPTSKLLPPPLRFVQVNPSLAIFTFTFLSLCILIYVCWFFLSLVINELMTSFWVTTKSIQKTQWSSYSSAQTFNWYFVSRKVIIDIYVLQN